PRVVGMRDQCHARRDQLRPGRLDDDVGLAVDPAEAYAVRRARLLAVLEFRLRDRGAVVDVPQRGRLRLVRLTPGEVPPERARWPTRCRPTPSDRRPRRRAYAGTGRWSPSAHIRTPTPCAATR